MTLDLRLLPQRDRPPRRGSPRNLAAATAFQRQPSARVVRSAARNGGMRRCGKTGTGAFPPRSFAAAVSGAEPLSGSVPDSNFGSSCVHPVGGGESSSTATAATGSAAVGLYRGERHQKHCPGRRHERYSAVAAVDNGVGVGHRDCPRRKCAGGFGIRPREALPHRPPGSGSDPQPKKCIPKETPRKKRRAPGFEGDTPGRGIYHYS